MNEGSGATLWEATAPRGEDYPALAGAIRAEVVVVGAGYTGLAAALALAAAGKAVVVLEARDVGAAASGRNGGQVIPGLKYDPEDLLARFGDAAGSALIATAGSGPDRVFELIDRHAIDCDARRAGWLQLATSAEALGPIESRARQWRACGAPVETLGRDQAARLTGSRRYLGGLVDRRGGALHPLKYVRGLASAATRGGVRLFARTPALSMTREGPEWCVTTPAGRVSAPQIVLATNAYADAFSGALRRSVVAVPSLQAATEPLPESWLRDILPEGQPVSDTWRLLRYFRVGPGGRLVMGSRGVFGNASPAAAAGPQHRAVREIYPQLAGVRFEFHWAGRVAMTPDHLPHLHDVAPGVVAGLGFNGRGVAMATTLGALLARRLAGETAAELGFPVTPVRPMALHALSRLGAAAAIQYLRLRDALTRVTERRATARQTDGPHVSERRAR